MALVLQDETVDLLDALTDTGHELSVKFVIAASTIVLVYDGEETSFTTEEELITHLKTLTSKE